MSGSAASPLAPPPRSVHELSVAEVRRVIFASSLGTVFEWYDFYLYGSLAAIISRQFFSGVNPTAGFIFALLAFAAGFAVRPFGALVFGRLGDLVGHVRPPSRSRRPARSAGSGSSSPRLPSPA